MGSPGVTRKPVGALMAIMALLTVMAGVSAGGSPAHAQMPREPESEIDPKVFVIDEFKFLGVQPDKGLKLVDEQGQPFTLGSREGKPLILVLSYYNCDGTCSVINGDLAKLLAGQSAWTLGKDFNVLTVSFDPHDTQQSLAQFKKKLALPDEWKAGWTLALPATPDQAKVLADTVGFKFFWSNLDHSFLHPGVYVFLSPEGRVVRYLYTSQAKSFDIGLALTDALGNHITPQELVNFAVGLCYSYNYKDGRYKLNIPGFIGAGSLLFGITTFVLSVLVYRRRPNRGKS